MNRLLYTATAASLIAAGLVGCSSPQDDLADAYDSCTNGEYLHSRAILDPHIKAAVDGMDNPKDDLELVVRGMYTVFDSEDGFMAIEGAFQQSNSNETFQGAVSGYVTSCVFNTLDIPAKVQEHIASTRALDGTQEDSWGGYTARWTYHPNAGLDFSVWAE